MKYLFLICFAALVSIQACVAASVDDTKAIQGTWIPVSAVLSGAPMSDEVMKSISLTLDQGKYAVLVGDAPDNGIYSIDPSTNPKGMTVTGTEGPNRGKTFPAIYELKDDTLRICYDLSGVLRPAEFKSEAGTLHYLVTYRRK